MTIQDVIDNDLTNDIRTGTAADDSVEMIDFPGSVLPNFEYKYYKNSGFDTPVQVRHNVFSGTLLCGLRVNLGGLSN